MKNHEYHKKSRIWEKMRGWKGMWFHLAGIIAIAWFLVRVVPKPQRAQYPCQQVAISISLGYIAFWSILFAGLVVWLRHAKTRVAKTIPTVLSGFVVLFTITGAVFATNYFQGEQPAATAWDPIPKEPMGVGTGVNPGRVVWVWNPNATEEELSGYWWEQENNHQDVINQMVSIGVQQFAGTATDAEAWDAIFTYFNEAHGNGNTSYQPGEKIAIKMNLNNALGGIGDPYPKEDNDRDASPYVVKALLRQLVNVVGVAQEDITVFDASRPILNCLYNRIYYENYPADPLVEEFSQIHYVDSIGGATGRERVIPSSTTMHFSDGVVRTLPTCVIEAKYLINIPILKRHPINTGVTLSGKNFFGSFIEPVADLHPYHISGLTMGNAAPQVDLFAYEHLGGKTLLYLGDGTFGTKVDHKTIAKFLMYPFNDDWTNSLFFSQDPVALDSVMYDFLLTEGTNPIEGAQNYLHQAAVPPPNVYDPENDGTYLSTCLGVHEHWDRTVDIFSSERYVGASFNGIDYHTCGEEFVRPGIVFTTPQEKHLYVFGADKGAFPVSLIIGKIDVEAQVNGVSGTVEKIEFYRNNKLQFTDSEAPYLWTWNKVSFLPHTIKIIAYYDAVNTTSNQIKVWKLL
ncbi:MAG: Ig-like domain-containing protein [Candidatus Thermoplasmatota archaeon]